MPVPTPNILNRLYPRTALSCLGQERQLTPHDTYVEKARQKNSMDSSTHETPRTRPQEELALLEALRASLR